MRYENTDGKWGRNSRVNLKHNGETVVVKVLRAVTAF